MLGPKWASVYNIDLFTREKNFLSQIREEFVISIFSVFVRTNSIPDITIFWNLLFQI